MKTERVVIALVFSFALMLVSACPSQAQSTNAAETLNQSTNSQPSAADFQQAVLAYQQSPSEATAEKVVKMATMDQLPPIPEEARKHFVRGGTLLKAAKFPDDFKEVIDEFTQATHLAPWWPNARYNLAVAQEAAGDYIIALNNLKLYQLFKLTEDEARVAQSTQWKLKRRRRRRRLRHVSTKLRLTKPLAIMQTPSSSSSSTCHSNFRKPRRTKTMFRSNSISSKPSRKKRRRRRKNRGLKERGVCGLIAQTWIRGRCDASPLGPILSHI